MWLAAAVSIVLYGLLWLQLLRRVDGQMSGWRVRLRFLSPPGIGENRGEAGLDDLEEDDGLDRDRRQRERDARKMLVYPLCLIVRVLYTAH